MSPCKDCGGKCCKYFALQIDTPRGKRDFENLRWYLAHKDVCIYVEKRKWFLEIKNPCRYLTEDHKCSIYSDRPLICREHSAYDCEKEFNDFSFDLVFHDIKELDKYLQERFRKK